MRDAGLEQAIKAAGGVASLARAVGISQPSVSAWSRVPAERVLAIEALTNVQRCILRPDLYGPAERLVLVKSEVDEIDQLRAENGLLSLLLGRGGTMQFGIFDQNDRGPYPLGEQYENRLKLIEFYDSAGFRSYHMSEHHSTPLNLAPSPSVFLAAAAQRTRRLRLGALVYILPTHHPLRLAEEICMLDHLSHGRLEVGIGRGASPHEIGYYGIDPDHAPAMYVEAYNVIMQALTQPEVNFSGKYYNFGNVPIEMKPAQLPHPPLWYAVPVPEGAVWPAQNRINIVCGGPLPRVREITDRYRAEWAAMGNSSTDIPLLGINRFVIAADSDREAMELGRRAWPVFYASFMKLWIKHATQPRYARIPEDFDTMVKNGGALAGSPATIRDQVRSMTGEAGANYFISQFSFGDLSHHEVLHSAGLFARAMLVPSQEPLAHAI